MTILNVFRFSGNNEKAKYESYTAAKENVTVLDALLDIKATQDSSLTFRHSCKSGKCGSCAMTIDGKQALACQTKLHSQEMKVEPLRAFPILRDLVTDMRRFWQEFENTKPWLIANAKKSLAFKPEEMRAAEHAAQCVQCGACSTACTLFVKDKTFLGPAAATTIYRFVADPRDIRQKERLELAVDKNMWNCTRMYDCAEACPVGIDPADLIRQLRQMAIKEKVKITHPAAARATVMLHSLVEFGTPDEIKAYLATKQLKIATSLPIIQEIAKKKRLPEKDIKPLPAAKDTKVLARGIVK